jgi:hypothetical protein
MAVINPRIAATTMISTRVKPLRFREVRCISANSSGLHIRFRDVGVSVLVQPVLFSYCEHTYLV